MRRHSRTLRFLAVATTLLAAGTTAAPAGTANAAPPAQPPVRGNPYLGAQGYRNLDWSGRARAAADEGGVLGAAMATVARQPTAVWLDSIAAIDGVDGRKGLRGHLEAALAQQHADGRPVVATFVLYNLPGRSCGRAPNGELAATPSGLTAYRTRFIDPIADILADPAYREVRVVMVVEPDALGNEALPAAAPTVECEQVRRAGVYLDAIPYALSRLHDIANVHTYLDIAQSNQLGWSSTLSAAVGLITTVAGRTPAGVASIDGFAVNVAEYDPTVEPFLDVDMTVNGTRITQSRFIDFNNHIEEHTYLDAMYAALVDAGFPEDIGMLLDTSRNGWGGARRPVAPSTARQVDTFVDQSRVDRRPTRFTWCNQVGAGIGELPRAAPAAHVHAYAWIKPPGESDGHYGPMSDRVGDIRCGGSAELPPVGGSPRPTNAMPGAPARGAWFPAAFTELVRNAHPPLG